MEVFRKFIKFGTGSHPLGANINQFQSGLTLVCFEKDLPENDCDLKIELKIDHYYHPKVENCHHLKNNSNRTGDWPLAVSPCHLVLTEIKRQHRVST